MTAENQNTPSTEKPTTQNRSTMVALLLVFALPIIIAYSGWWLGWFKDLSTVNKGELLKPVILLEDTGLQYQGRDLLEKDLNHHWWLLYVAEDKNCQHKCQVNAYLINQTRVALAKEMDRVEKLMVNYGEGFSEESKLYVAKHFSNPRFNWIKRSERLKPGYVYLMDPLGNIMLRYEAVNTDREASFRGKEILFDLKKLLKFSRLG